MNDPRLLIAKVKFVTFTFFQTFEIIWFIYLNTFAYRDINVDSEDTAFVLVALAIIMAYGYILIILYFLLLCAGYKVLKIM